jgi:hypothetical protein
MVVTVSTVHVVEMPLDQIVDVVAVRYRCMTTCRTVTMAPLVATAIVIRRAFRRIGVAHRKGVLLYV